jgi:serine/threonine-protein kinase HipA
MNPSSEPKYKPQLQLYYQQTHVGTLTAKQNSVGFTFDYTEHWTKTGFALSPALPLDQPLKERSVTVFFQNLLPEGQNLDNIALALRVSKNNRFQLLHAIGEDAAGAFVLTTQLDNTPKTKDRPLTHTELSARLALRERRDFAIWDQKVRVSVAGFQDKIGIKVKDQQWFLPEGQNNHTSHILKPPPVNAQFESMVVNEAFCMQLSERIGLPTAGCQLVEVPEPVLLIERFDRTLQTNGSYGKRHVIDGCQLLDLPPHYKMERPYGSSPDVAMIREGASIVKLAQAIRQYSAAPILDIKTFMEWIAFQLCIGNVDAHAKNLSFFVQADSRIRIAPFYDQVCILELEGLEERVSKGTPAGIDTQLAMAIGDEFTISQVSAYDLALMAQEAAFPIKAMKTVFDRVTQGVIQQLENVQVVDYYQRLTNQKHIIQHATLKLQKHLAQLEQAYQDL